MLIWRYYLYGYKFWLCAFPIILADFRLPGSGSRRKTGSNPIRIHIIDRHKFWNLFILDMRTQESSGAGLPQAQFVQPVVYSARENILFTAFW